MPSESSNTILILPCSRFPSFKAFSRLRERVLESSFVKRTSDSGNLRPLIFSLSMAKGLVASIMALGFKWLENQKSTVWCCTYRNGAALQKTKLLSKSLSSQLGQDFYQLFGFLASNAVFQAFLISYFYGIVALGEKTDLILKMQVINRAVQEVF